MTAQQSQGYAPGWDLDLKYGQDGERTVAHLLGIPEGRVEVKRDRHTDSLNLFIETHKYTQGWVPSGLRTSLADQWAFVFGATTTFVPIHVLRAAVCVLNLKEIVVDSGVPTKGVLLPRVLLQQVPA